METSSHVDCYVSYQIVAREFLEKVTKFGGVCFNIQNVINVQSCRRQNLPPPPPVWIGLIISDVNISYVTRVVAGWVVMNN